MKTNTALIISLLIAVSIISLEYKQINRLKTERDVYQNNTESVMNGIEQLRKDSAQQAYRISSLTLTAKEYQKYREQDAQQIRDLKVQLKKLKSVSTQKIEVSAPILAPIIKDTIQQTRIVRMENKHISLVGVIKGDSLKAHIRMPLTLHQMVYVIPKHRFLWWSWGVKGVKQIITTDNPYAKLQYSEYIEIR